MLTADQVTAIVPDAASLKAGRGLGTPRKWQALGGDDGALWGLASGSGKDPYQTRVDLSDLSSKCSCPSRKFPCKHAIGLMLLAASNPSALVGKSRPDWLVEWLASREARKRENKSRETKAKPVDEKAAARRRQKKASRMDEGVALMRQTLADLIREGLASQTARDPALWEGMQRRMVDCQAPGLASAAHGIAEFLLRDDEVDERFALEFGWLHLLCECHGRRDQLDEPARAEMAALLGDGPSNEEVLALPPVHDTWFVSTREILERDRMLTSVTWLWGIGTRRWAKVLRFAHLPATLAEPWPLGATVEVGLSFDPGQVPQRARPHGEGHARRDGFSKASETGFEDLLERHAAMLATSPLVRSSPFLLEIRRDEPGFLADAAGRRLPWRADSSTTFLVDCLTGGVPTLAGGEWDGQRLRLLAMAAGESWIPLHNNA